MSDVCEWLLRGCDCSPTEAKKCYESIKEKLAQNKLRYYISDVKKSNQKPK